MNKGLLEVKFSSCGYPSGTPELWRSFSDQSQESFYQGLTRGLPKGTKVFLVLHNDGSPEGMRISFSESDKNNFCFSRYFYQQGENWVAQHSTARVNGGMQGHNISRIVQRNLMEFYGRLKVKKIELKASEVGVYAWARAGFVPYGYEWGQLRGRIAGRMRFLEAYPDPKEGALPPECVRTVNDALHDGNPKNLWRIVDMKQKCYGLPLGKLLILPWTKQYMHRDFPLLDAKRYGATEQVFWDGKFDMADKDCIARMKAYIDVIPKDQPEMKARPKKGKGPVFSK